MKKLYSIALGILLGTAFASADNEVKLTQGETETWYSGNNAIVTAYEAVTADGAIIEVYANNNITKRLGHTYNITIKGVGEGITLTHNNSQANNAIAILGKNKTLTFENLTLTSTGNIPSDGGYFRLENETSTLMLKNVTLKKGTNAPVLLNKGKKDFQLYLEDTTLDGFTKESLVIGDLSQSYKLHLKGNNSLACKIVNGQIVIDAQGITNAEKIKLDLTSYVDFTKTIITGITDLTKFESTNNLITLKVNDTNDGIYAEAAAVIVKTGNSEDGVDGKAFSSLKLAKEAVDALATKPATATFELQMDQNISERYGFSGSYSMVITSADPENPVVIKNTHSKKGEALFLNNNQNNTTHTLKNIIIDGGNIYDRTGAIIECAKGGAKTYVVNSKIQNVKTTDNRIFTVKGGGHIEITNVSFGENTNENPFIEVGTPGSSIAGNTNIGITFLNKDLYINGENWTPTEKVNVKFNEGTSNHYNTIHGFTDVDKLIAPEGWALYVDGNNIKATNDKVAAPTGERALVEGKDVVTLKVDGNENAKIYYTTTSTNVAPASVDNLYEAPIDLNELEEGTHYLWAQSSATGLVNSNIVLIGIYDVTAAGVELSGLTYTKVMDNDGLIAGHYYIIVGKHDDGTHHAYGPQGAHAVNVVEDKIYAHREDFKNVHEYKWDGNNLVLDGAAPAMMTYDTTPSVTINEGKATVTIGGNAVKFNPTDGTFGDTDAHTGNVMLFTTGSEANTGVDNVAVDKANAPVEYYNLQGVRVENPAHGLYIKRQGNKATKVCIK